MTQWFETFGELNLEELKAAQSIIKMLIDNKVNKELSEVGIGDLVYVDHQRVSGLKFKVVKINRKKMKLKEIKSGTVYNVSLGLVKKAK